MFKNKVKIDTANIMLVIAIKIYFANREHSIFDSYLYFNMSTPEYIDENFFAACDLLQLIEVNV